MLNWALMKNPLNWFTIILMLMIALFFFHFSAKLVEQKLGGNS